LSSLVRGAFYFLEVNASGRAPGDGEVTDRAKTYAISLPPASARKTSGWPAAPLSVASMPKIPRTTSPPPGKIRLPPPGTGIRWIASTPLTPFRPSTISCLKLIAWGRTGTRRSTGCGEYLRIRHRRRQDQHPVSPSGDGKRAVARGELGTHFVDREITLINDMKRSSRARRA
jgi:hypothetical protein